MKRPQGTALLRDVTMSRQVSCWHCSYPVSGRTRLSVVSCPGNAATRTYPRGLLRSTAVLPSAKGTIPTASQPPLAFLVDGVDCGRGTGRLGRRLEAREV